MACFTSILFPQGAVPKADEPEPGCLPDLHLDDIIAAVTAGHPDEHVDEFFYAPLHTVSAIEHRHQVFRDLELDHIRRPIQNFVDGMRTMRHRHHRATQLRHRLQHNGWFIDAVEKYCDTVTLLRDELEDLELTAPGLHSLRQYVREYVDGAKFRKLAGDTAAVQSELRKVRYAVHIHGRRVHVEKFSGQTDYSQGAIATFERFAAAESEDFHVPARERGDMNHVERQILECVAKLYPDTFALLAKFCRRSERFEDPAIIQFDHEIRFYLYYLAFIERFAPAGLNFCYPEVIAEPGTMFAAEAFDLALAIKSADKKTLVRNDFRLSGAERILVVTGPNQGGKTTFARTIGQCAYLASLGCPIPAGRAEFTLPDRIYTHFERQETLTTLHGRLEDELLRIHAVLSRATATSIIIMNESFASTTLRDALLIGTEILERIDELRSLAVYVTFLDELAGVNPACVSMVGEVAPDDPAQRTFNFTRRPADGLAYAAALANKYGLDHDALQKRIAR